MRRAMFNREGSAACGPLQEEIMFRNSRIMITAAFLAIALQEARAQNPAFTILEIERQNTVAYVEDVAHPNKLAMSPLMVDANLRNFMSFFAIADIVSVNGKPAKGSWVARGQFAMIGPTPAPGQAIGDIARGSVALQNVEILQNDGTPVGTIMISGFPSGVAPPGVPSELTWNLAVTGGTGAFLGAKGVFVTVPPFMFRAASVAEDPANRRIHGGPSGRFIIYLIPMSRPEIVSAAGGTAVFHSDFSLVTSSRPARAGETLIVKATGLGPTRPDLAPGTLFPESPLHQVNSPVEVTVSGKPADVLNQIGWPGTSNTYRVDIRVPDSITAGMAALQLTVAFIQGREVSIPVQ